MRYWPYGYEFWTVGSGGYSDLYVWEFMSQLEVLFSVFVIFFYFLYFWYLNLVN